MTRAQLKKIVAAAHEIAHEAVMEHKDNKSLSTDQRVVLVGPLAGALLAAALSDSPLVHGALMGRYEGIPA